MHTCLHAYMHTCLHAQTCNTVSALKTFPLSESVQPFKKQRKEANKQTNQKKTTLFVY